MKPGAGKNRLISVVITAAALAAVIIAAYLFFSGGAALSGKKAQDDAAYGALYSEGDNLIKISIFLGDAESDFFRVLEAEIYEAKAVVNRIKQALIKLFSDAPKGYVRPVPAGTGIKEVYMDSNSVVYVDLTEEFRVNHRGGTTAEYMAVYSVVNTIIHNFEGVRGVRLLVEGAEVDTLSGHIYMGGVLTAEDGLQVLPVLQ
ncbi:MAG TPA: hypothetical protein ENN43_03160 [bacterium]|nr:hypothetical protein [bacterium]